MAVLIASPSDTHVALGVTALEAGASVLIEKPIALDVQGARYLLEVAATSRGSLHVVSNMRLHPAISAIHEHLPRIGRPILARAHYGSYLPEMRPGTDYRKTYAASRARGGGVLLDAIHEIDYLGWLLGPVTSIVADVGTIGSLDIDAEDMAALIMHHTGGVRSEVHLDYLQRVKRRGCEIIGTEGTLVWDSRGKTPEQCSVALLDPMSRRAEVIFEDCDLDGNQPYREMLRAYGAILNAEPATGSDSAVSSGSEALQALATAQAALASAQDGRRIDIPPPQPSAFHSRCV